MRPVTKVTKLVALSQIMFLMLLGICIFIVPHFLFERNEGGMSNYGVYASTVVFYTLAFSLSAGLLLRAVHFLPQSENNHLIKLVFTTTAYSLLLELITTYPYQLNAILSDLHVAANFWTAIFELVAGGWIAFVWRRNLINILLFILLLVSFSLSVLVFLGAIHILFITQIAAAISVGLLLIRSTLRPPSMQPPMSEQTE